MELLEDKIARIMAQSSQAALRAPPFRQSTSFNDLSKNSLNDSSNDEDDYNQLSSQNAIDPNDLSDIQNHSIEEDEIRGHGEVNSGVDDSNYCSFEIENEQSTSNDQYTLNDAKPSMSPTNQLSTENKPRARLSMDSVDFRMTDTNANGSTANRNDNNLFLVPSESGGLVTVLPKISTPRAKSAERVVQNARRHSGSSASGGQLKAHSQTLLDIPPEFTPQHRRLPPSQTSRGQSGLSPSAQREPKACHSVATELETSKQWSLTRRRFTSVHADRSPLSISVEEHTSDSSKLSVAASAMAVVERPIKVAVRVRPFSILEKQQGARRIVSCMDNKLVVVNPRSFDADPDAIVAAAFAVNGADWARSFVFDHCLWSYDPLDTEDEYVGQEGVHRAIGLEVVESILSGVSASCFAYGHTGTGKTHSFFGNLTPPISTLSDISNNLQTEIEIENEEDNEWSRYDLREQSGLVPRVLTDVLEGLQRQDGGDDTRVTLSFMEIYNERIRDLLSSHATTNGNGNEGDLEGEGNVPILLRVREHPVLGPYVERLTKIEVHSAREALRLLYEGHQHRATSHTMWDAESSRSHAIVTLELTPIHVQAPLATNVCRNSFPNVRQSVSSSFTVDRDETSANPYPPFVRLQMADLAGSEKEVVSQWDTPLNRRSLSVGGKKTASPSSSISFSDSRQESAAEKQHAQENRFIRRSLSTLGYIIKALGKGATFKSLPYRDTVLTWLLKDALNGRNHTTMLATISPANSCYEETLNTLKYAERLCLVGNRSNPFGDLSVPLAGGPKDERVKPATKHVDLSEYAHIFHSLGANKPGSKAFRQLLRQTVSDPQQRLARIFENTDVSERETSETSTKSANGPLDGINRATTSLETTQSKLIELELELNAMRIERDSLALELQTTREALVEGRVRELEATPINNNHIASRSLAMLTHGTPVLSGSNAYDQNQHSLPHTQSYQHLEREMQHLKQVLVRKDALLTRLQDESHDEQDRQNQAMQNMELRLQSVLSDYENLEELYHVQERELTLAIAQLDSLRQNKVNWDTKLQEMNAENERLRQEISTATESNLSLQKEILQVRDDLSSVQQKFDESKNTMEESTADEVADLRSQLTAAQQEICQQQLSLTRLTQLSDDIRTLKSINAAQDKELNELREAQAAFEVNVQTATILNSSSEQVVDKCWLDLEASVKSYLRDHGSLIDSFEGNKVDIKSLADLVDALPKPSLVNEQILEMRSEIQSLSEQLNSEQMIRNSVEQENHRSLTADAAKSQLRSEIKLKDSESDAPTSSAVIPGSAVSAVEIAQLISDELARRLQPAPNSDREQSMKDSATEKLCQMLIDQVSQLRESVESSEVKAQYWQQTVQQMTALSLASQQLSDTAKSQVDTATFERLKGENTMLSEQLSVARAEAQVAKAELHDKQQSMQSEFTSLWLAVQEVNKLDVDKERTLSSVIAERDAALQGQNELRARLKEVTRGYNQLKEELQAIDRDLLEAAQAESIDIVIGSGGIGGASRLIALTDGQRPTGIAANNFGAAFAGSGTNVDAGIGPSESSSSKHAGTSQAYMSGSSKQRRIPKTAGTGAANGIVIGRQVLTNASTDQSWRRTHDTSGNQSSSRSRQVNNANSTITSTDT